MSTRVLVPVDGSDQAEQALETALDLFDDAELVVFHAINEGSLDYANSMVGGRDRSLDDQIEQTVEGQARDLVDRALDIAKERGVAATGETRRGKPAPTIIEYAEENDVDHIVMGSHGHAGMTQRWFGSVADRVVKGAPVTVTVVR
jgi:nucleotide-binding universal stress UspA family protein